MARSRLIARALSTSEKRAKLHQVAGKLAEFCQALYPLLIAHADDFGRQAGDVFTIKHAVDPSSPRKEADFEAALVALHRVGLVIWYEAEGRKCLQITDFDRHQSGLHKRTKSLIPEPSGNFREIPSEQNRTELKGTEQNGSVQAQERGTRTDTPDGFDAFWLAYPKRKSKDDAIKAWRKLTPDAALQSDILAALSWQRQASDWTKDGGQFIPLPASYLNGRRWEDEPTRVAAFGGTSKTAGNLEALRAFVAGGRS